ncbi:UPF0462 protein C4orf33 homolog isoform X2 [Nycticebus coucang]|uniref:UPF0462 protein C4orf33 homolog isoform X2 n=1 Tax=Nycticebus coucang TaxID=9470 RepID=UPI00234E35BB|nr:UPF0462 protein C4orf33 homolog isoform X2 [Nycticebus coucang]
MNFKIEHTWDGFPVKHEPVFVRLNPGDRGVMMEVSAPFFNDPPAPLGETGKPFNELWNHEVVEAFFLNDITEQYLEVELCPHGQHLVLLLSGRRNVWKQELALSFEVSREETKWEGKAYLPWSYFPPNVTKFNAFAIHGSKDKRSYEALYPVPQQELQEGQKPDFFQFSPSVLSDTSATLNTCGKLLIYSDMRKPGGLKDLIPLAYGDRSECLELFTPNK